MWIHDRRLIFALGAIWISAVSIGVGKLMAYENTPAKTAVLGPAWPSDSQLKTQPDRFTLVMSVHPHCPCSRASLDELAIIASRCRQLSINLLFTQPSSASPEWVKSSLWQQAQAIPASKTIVDFQSREARLFKLLTSGEIALYSPSGQLVFHGGITAARGHIGDNRGLNTIIALVNGRSDNTAKTQVFGCALINSGSASDARN
jgi:hypothetical protein